MSAQDWAWEQVRSPNLRFEPETALTLLGFAKLADDALNSPNGYGRTETADVARLTGADVEDLVPRTISLANCGLLTRELLGGYRIPEEAFA